MKVVGFIDKYRYVLHDNNSDDCYYIRINKKRPDCATRFALAAITGLDIEDVSCVGYVVDFIEVERELDDNYLSTHRFFIGKNVSKIIFLWGKNNMAEIWERKSYVNEKLRFSLMAGSKSLFSRWKRLKSDMVTFL